MAATFIIISLIDIFLIFFQSFSVIKAIIFCGNSRFLLSIKLELRELQTKSR